jgi:hypothetical protein
MAKAAEIPSQAGGQDPARVCRPESTTPKIIITPALVRAGFRPHSRTWKLDAETR